MLLPTQRSTLLLFRMLSPFLSYLLTLLACILRGAERETDWPLQGPKA